MDIDVNERDLVSDQQIVDLLKKVSMVERVWLTVLILSGRRQSDVNKISAGSLKNDGNATFVLLPKDKMHQNSLISFEFRWAWNLDFDLQPLKCEFFRLFSNCEKPFNNINIQSVRRKCDFKLHALRNRKAIMLAIEGRTKEYIMSYIGWSSDQSLLRYTRVPITILNKFTSYDDALKFISK